MIPKITLLGYEFSWFATFHFIGVLIAFIFGFFYAQKVKLPNDKNIYKLLWVLFAIFLVFFGSRLIGMIDYYLVMHDFESIKVLFKSPSYGHFSWSGSILFLVLGLPLAANLFKVSIQKQLFYFDFLSILLCLMTIFTKLGCQFSGDGCYGITTNLPWGMHFEYGPYPSILPVHPTALYDSLFHLFLFIWLLRIRKNETYYHGKTTLVYITTISIFYLALETIRNTPRLIIDFSVAQVVYFTILLIMVTCFLKYKRVY